MIGDCVLNALRAGLSLLVALAVSGAGSLWAASKPTEFQLANGLRVVVQEDKRAPVVVVQVWYKVGASYEPEGLTGISHALEHMMFKGSPKVPAGEFSRVVAQFGGADNAFTTDDYTAYYQLYAADRLPLALELEADRMQNLVLDPQEFAREIKVVMEERRLRTDDNPTATAYERFRALAYLTSPSRLPTVGWMRDLEAMKVEDLRAWYERWYAPNNATLVVVGDVDPAQVKTLAEQYFAAIPARTLPVARLPVELAAPGKRELSLDLPAKVPTLYMGYNLPALSTQSAPDEAYVLRMLAGVLDEGQSARLETRVIREQRLAAAVSSSYDMFARGDALLTVTAVPNEGKELEAVRDALLAEVEKLKTEPIAPEELARVYAGIVASDVFARDSISAQANVIGALESVGLSWRVLDELPARLKAVTPEQIQAAARKYLQPERLSLLYLRPADASGVKP